MVSNPGSATNKWHMLIQLNMNSEPQFLYLQKVILISTLFCNCEIQM